MEFYELLQFPKSTRFAKHVTDIFGCIATLFVLLLCFSTKTTDVLLGLSSIWKELHCPHIIRYLKKKHISKWWCFVQANQFVSNREMITEFVDIAVFCCCLCDESCSSRASSQRKYKELFHLNCYTFLKCVTSMRKIIQLATVIKSNLLKSLRSLQQQQQKLQIVNFVYFFFSKSLVFNTNCSIFL